MVPTGNKNISRTNIVLVLLLLNYFTHSRQNLNKLKITCRTINLIPKTYSERNIKNKKLTQ